VEGNDGGRFTHALVQAANSLPLHQTSYIDLISYIISSDPSFDEHHGQTPQSLGLHKSRIIFHALPFGADENYIALDSHPASDHYRIELGSAHGIVEGTVLSMHRHNRRGSINPPLDSLKVLEVHGTWSLVRRRSWDGAHGEWAQVVRQKTPFKPSSYLRRHLPSAAIGRAIHV